MTILSFEHINLSKGGTPLLTDINWQIHSGEDWGLLGLNGAGKTLMLQMIAGNLWPSSGKLTVLGEVFGKTNIPDLTKRIGWVSNILQHKFYQNDVAEEIVLSGKFASIGIWQAYPAADLRTARELLASLGGASLLGKSYQVLSQGEKQLVLIARALMAKPELLILDEPCNGLDRSSALRIGRYRWSQSFPKNSSRRYPSLSPNNDGVIDHEHGWCVERWV